MKRKQVILCRNILYTIHYINKKHLETSRTTSKQFIRALIVISFHISTLYYHRYEWWIWINVVHMEATWSIKTALRIPKLYKCDEINYNLEFVIRRIQISVIIFNINICCLMLLDINVLHELSSHFEPTKLSNRNIRLNCDSSLHSF